MAPCPNGRCGSRTGALFEETAAKSRQIRPSPMQDPTPPAPRDNAIALKKSGVGQPIRRKEDDTLVRGKGKYTDDFTLPGQAYCFMVRSSHAHGIIKGIETA